MGARIVCALTAVAGGAILLGQMKASGFPDRDKVSLSGDLPGGEPLLGADIDIAVSRLGLSSAPNNPSDNFAYWGTSGGIRAFSMASTSCNVGNAVAQWVAGSSGNHPVIAQNMFRYLDGRFEQIGQSWLKHSFCAVNEDTCDTCQDTPCSTLGLGCADTYSSGLNDGANGGPKYQISPLGEGGGGTHTHPYDSPSGLAAIRGRLQIKDTDIQAGGQNFAEVHYITHDEPLDNRYNNASWREVNLSLTSISGTEPGQDSVHFEEPAIVAWRAQDPGVLIVPVDDPDKGRFFVGSRATDNGDGTWHYEYAVQNLNSDRSAGSFAVPLPAGVTITNAGFHDVEYHSGDGVGGATTSGTDWPMAVGGGMMTWSTQDFATNANANAVRWGTLYNYRFDADTPPVAVDVEIGLFKPGPGGPMTAAAIGPSVGLPCPTDVNNDGVTNVLDLIDLLLCFGLPAVPGCESEDVNTDGSVNVLDLIDLLLEFGNTCP